MGIAKQQVISYLEGNVLGTKAWLQRQSRTNVVKFFIELSNHKPQQQAGTIILSLLENW